MLRLTLTSIVVLVLAAACGDSSGGADTTPTDAADAADAAMDTPLLDTSMDAGPPDICDDLALPRRPFDDRAAGSDYGTVAGDFAVETTDGPWRLSEEWSGCESYVFLNYFASDPGDQLWGSFADPLFERSARNVRYFFTSYETSPTDITARMDQMRANVDEAFSFMAPEEADFWRQRVHYVVTPIREIEGSLGELVRSRTSVEFAVGIDRAQRYDPVGSLAEVSGGAFLSRLGMAAWVSRYYDYRYALDERLAAESGVTIVALVDETNWFERSFDRAVTLPAAATMTGFDTLEVDVQIECHNGPGECSEWDRIAAIFFCTDATCDDRRELVRWITPYSRPGRRRWVIDATPMLGLLAAGGDSSFRIVMGPGFEDATTRDVQVSLRLSSRGAPDRPIRADLAFSGGAFDATYNAAQAPYLFTPPTGTVRVELVTILSGHGQTAGDNCAEWCDHEHEMRVNGGAARTIDYPGMAGTQNGCAELVDRGVIPGQYGNWAPLRAGWCPGYPVDAVRIDVTDDVMLTAENEVTYQAMYAGGEPRGGNIDLLTYVVFFR